MCGHVMSLPKLVIPKCEGCLSDITSQDFVTCAYGNCRKAYHTGLCIGGPVPNEDQKSSWICPKCICSMKRSGPNCSTPVRALDAPDPRMNVTFRRNNNIPSEAVALAQDAISYDRFEALLDSKLEAIRATLALEFSHAIEKLNKEVKDDISDIKSRLLKVEVENEKLMCHVVECERSKISAPLQASSTELLDAISQLKAELNERDQMNLENVVEISGIPETDGESPLHIAHAVALKVGMQLDEREVISVMRAGPRRLQSSTSDGPSLRPRPVVLRLARRAIRDELMKNFRTRRGVTTADMGLPQHEPKPFYINERLTRENRALFGKARELGRKNGWRFVWTKEGRVLAKRDEKTTFFTIRTEKDLGRVFGVSLDLMSQT